MYEKSVPMVRRSVGELPAKLVDVSPVLPDRNEISEQVAGAPKRPRMETNDDVRVRPTGSFQNQTVMRGMSSLPAEIREIILVYVIHNGQKSSPTDIKSCRLVHPTWLATVDKCLEKSQNPLFTLALPPPSAKKSPQHFDAMISKFDADPPMGMILESEYFAKGFKQVLHKLNHYATSLVRLSLHLEVCFQVFTEPLTEKQAVALPLLQTLEVDFYVKPPKYVGMYQIRIVAGKIK